MKKIVMANLSRLIGLILIGCALRCFQHGPIARSVDVKRSIPPSHSKLTFKTTVSQESAIAPSTDETVLARYILVNDRLFPYLVQPSVKFWFDRDLSLQESHAQDKHQRLFNFFARIIPQEIRTGIQYFEVFDPKTISALAYMSFDHELTSFSLGMSYNLLDVKSYYSNSMRGYPLIVWVIIHEFGHYVTLHKKQQYIAMNLFDPFARSGSILRKIESTSSYKKIGACDRLNDPAAASRCKRKLVQEGEFVTEYATTSSIEDAAETFVYFILLDKPTKLGVNGMDDKILLFWEIPDLVEIRTKIRTNLKEIGIYRGMSWRECYQKIQDLVRYTGDPIKNLAA